MLGRSDSNSELYPASRVVSLIGGPDFLPSGPSRGPRIAPVERAGNHRPAARWLLRAPPLRTGRRLRRACRNRGETPGRHVPRLTKLDWCSSSRRAWPTRTPPDAGALLVGVAIARPKGSLIASLSRGFRQNLLAIVRHNQLAVVPQEMTQGTVRAALGGRVDRRTAASGLSQRFGSSAHFEVCAAPPGSGHRCYGNGVRAAEWRAGAKRQGCTGALAPRLYSSGSRRERTHRPLLDERYAYVRRLSLDGNSD